MAYEKNSVRRNEFDLSHEHKLSLDMGWLVPCMVEEVLPGDTFLHKASALARVAPLAKPLMHRVELRMHSFFVPNRILWDQWENFITGETTTEDKPTQFVQAGDKLADHMGIPPTAGLEVDALPFRAYAMIYNEYYRDQDLQPEISLDNTELQRICWQKDYFTVARPKPQQGEAVPLGFQSGLAPVNGIGWTSASSNSGLSSFKETVGAQPSGAARGAATNQSGVFIAEDPDNTNRPFVHADLSGVEGGIAIDDLRRSMALQRFAEARMRFGHRYVDYLRYCGVNPSDGRLSRPEYLGGGKDTLNFSEVLATADGTSTNVGDLYGHGIGMGNSGLYRKYFEEHGWVITLISARPKTVYSEALPKKFLRTDPMDYHQRELEVMPWQEVRQNEVHKNGDPNTIFGYVPRYEEYRHSTSQVSGTLRGGTENDWHMAREFSTPPSLNGSFVECTPTERIYSDASMPDLIVNVMHSLRARRGIGQTASMGMDL
ncbi:major capsid protein [Microviridae sp.]|nr:major capsid protein [Microviridae sp.]